MILDAYTKCMNTKQPSLSMNNQCGTFCATQYTSIAAIKFEIYMSL